jgi:hypothetical protein
MPKPTEVPEAVLRLVADVNAEAEAAGVPPLIADRCKVCGLVIGYGLVEYHVGLCDECRDQKES